MPDFKQKRLKALREMTLDELKAEAKKIRAQRAEPTKHITTVRREKKKTGLASILAGLPAEEAARLRKAGIV